MDSGTSLIGQPPTHNVRLKRPSSDMLKNKKSNELKYVSVTVVEMCGVLSRECSTKIAYY